MLCGDFLFLEDNYRVKHTLTRSKGLRGMVHVPGDKSISHRALMIASLANGASEIHRFLDAADPRSTRACLEMLGIDFELKGDALRVHGRGLRGLRAPIRELDAGNSGTTLRLLAGILAGQPFVSRLLGDASLSQRPMKRIIEPLSLMGARIESSDRATAPLTVYGTFPLKAIHYEMPISSAQVKSAVLLAGLFAEGDTSVVETIATRDHTERMLRLERRVQNGRFVITSRGGMNIEPRLFSIPGDLSSAAFLIVAATIVPGSDVLVKNIGLNPTRSRYIDLLRSLGADIQEERVEVFSGEPQGDLRVRSATLKGDLVLDGDTSAEVIDEIPILAIASLFSQGSFRLTGASDLRNKESDRISAVVRNLRALGCEVEEYADGFAFEGKKGVIGAEIDSFGDHRIAMAFGVAGLAAEGSTTIHGAECVAISFPGFWELLSELQRS
jgi:3-phosphoshikimate 1-carboxyvinyltransferase